MRRLSRSWLGFAAWAGALGLAVALYALFVEPVWVKVEHASFEQPSPHDPRREGRYRVAFVSDFDLDDGPGLFARRVREIVNRLAVDLIAVGGDLFGGHDGPPTAAALSALSEWLAGFRARDGMVVVWGEQEAGWAERLQAVLPSGVRSLESATELHEAQDARIRFCGPGSMYAPLWIEPRRGGRLRAGWGASLTVARYLGRAGAAGTSPPAWSGIDLRARLRVGWPGDAPGVAVLESAERAGYRFHVSPVTQRWRAVSNPGTAWYGSSRASSGFVMPGKDYHVRVRVEPDAQATRVRSRLWLAGDPEPDEWPIDFVDTSARRPTSGTIAIVAGGAWTGSKTQSWEYVGARDLDGTLLVEESFDDPERFSREWDNPGRRLEDFDLSVVIGHNPRMLLPLPATARPTIDLVLAGHTHGGQVRLPLFGPLHVEPGLPREWAEGLTRLDGGRVWLYTSRGVGVSRVPVRFLCRPEVTEMELIVRSRPPR
ncbi:MAG: hypothetical protein JSV80_06120 [Acidobacteriota bacterium]|nr:MAG: hypothetical protein JSV80_06120 [Acidobacteriota bacterium]